MIDIFENLKTKEIKCLDKGHVRILDCMPRLVPEGQTADYRIVQAARVSYGDGTKTLNEDRGLIRYLLRHKHTSPIEKIRFEFHVKLPLCIRSQWQRHRMGSFNELSGRYSVMKDEFYIPDENNVRSASTKNKQVSEGCVSEEIAKGFRQGLERDCFTAYHHYTKDISNGIGKEQARMGLPQNLYTEFYWTVDLHNLLHFLSLRCHHHAQQEIQVYANAVLELIRPIVPITVEAWEDYDPMRGAVTLTALEILALKQSIINGSDIIRPLNSENKREQQEWVEKAKLLGLREKTNE